MKSPSHVSVLYENDEEGEDRICIGTGCVLVQPKLFVAVTNTVVVAFPKKVVLLLAGLLKKEEGLQLIEY